MNNTEKLEGIYNLGKGGIGFVKSRQIKDVIEVPKHESNTALHKDIVHFEITNEKKHEGRVLEVVKRAKAGFVGTLKHHDNRYTVDTDDFKIPDIQITSHDLEVAVGNKVFVRITEYGNTLRGVIEKDLGKPGSNDSNMNGIALEQGFDFSFPEDVDQEANALEERGITDEDRTGRRDMRNDLTFTIDPEDAKDFDDALSFTTLPNGNYEIGIHIADVSHYVTPGSALDREAQKRTTSVYLVDRTIPMLPEALSNGLCSLREDEEKLAFSAVFEIVPQTGDVVSEWFGRTLIRSNKRFTYEEAQAIIDQKDGLYVQELLELNRLAKIYERKREQQGALSFETHEVKFILDEDGVPISVKVKQRIDTNKLIEEFMLLANSGVAQYMQDAPFFVYRIHDKPEFEKMEKLQAFLKLLDYETQMVDQMIPVKKLQQIIKDAEGKPEYDTLQTVIVRSMQKAIYTTNNIGHFGLAFKHYSHFTSPIRRYPDVLAHRLLQHQLDGTHSQYDQSWHEKMCGHSSEQEQSAVTAERNSIKLKQVEYMKTKDQNEEFDGIVTGASKFGVFVAEMESRSEGMIRLSDLGNDFWEYREKTGTVVGQKTKKQFKIGDVLKIKIKKVDLDKRIIDYTIAQSRSEKKHPKQSGHHKKKFDGK